MGVVTGLSTNEEISTTLLTSVLGLLGGGTLTIGVFRPEGSEVDVRQVGIGLFALGFGVLVAILSAVWVREHGLPMGTDIYSVSLRSTGGQELVRLRQELDTAEETQDVDAMSLACQRTLRPWSDGARTEMGRDTWIAEAEISTRANELKRIVHQLYIFSSSFSGGMARDGSRQGRRDLQSRKGAGLWFRDELTQRARVAIVAAEAGQVVLDGERGQGSNFGSALVNALRFSGGGSYLNGDYNRNGCVSHHELLLYLTDNGRSSRSGPRRGKIGEDDRGGVIALCSPWPVHGEHPLSPEQLQVRRSLHVRPSPLKVSVAPSMQLSEDGMSKPPPAAGGDSLEDLLARAEALRREKAEADR
nr:hypothetical protein [Myxococcales bacterium]